MKQFTFVIEVDRCIGCKGCQVACKLENRVALGSGRNKVCTVGPVGSYPDIQMYFLPTMCQECEDPPCILYCPTNACYKGNEDGVIYINKDICIGCGICRKNCPYGCIIENKELRISDKCDLCSHLREKNELPACIRTCSGSALHFGDINDPEDEVTKLLANTPGEQIYTLEDYDNHPSVRYILKKAKWINVLPKNSIEHSVFLSNNP